MEKLDLRKQLKRCAQILHVGPYLTDIRRADPSRWKTVIRQPME